MTDILAVGPEEAICDLDQTVSRRSNIYYRASSDDFFSYYDIATGFYETAWGQSFHFCRFGPGEGFLQALARHEHYLALQMGLKKGMKVLDVGCGVGGPAREIARFADVHITGLNNNDYQIERAEAAALKVGLSKQLKFVKGDFMVSHLLYISRMNDPV